MKKYFSIGILFITLFIFSGCNNNASDYISRQTIFFDTIVQIRIYDTDAEEILDECLELCKSYEHLFSRTLEDSDISRINAADGEAVDVSSETIDLIKTALYYCELSDGAFDITLAPVSDLWDFQNNSGYIPSDTDLKNALNSVNYQNIVITGNSIQLSDPDTEIDLGAIAKGYIADQLKNFLIESGIQHALIDLGGNILTLGGKPDNTDFTIAIQKPFDEHGTPITTLKTTDDSIVTSGIYQRYVEIDGRIYHHILDSETGYPADNSLFSVTIISNSSTTADALSTACFVLGPDRGMQLINETDGTEAVFVTNEYELIYSDGLK